MSSSREINSRLQLNNTETSAKNEQEIYVVNAPSLNKSKQVNAAPSYILKEKLAKKERPEQLNLLCEQGVQLVESYINQEYKDKFPKLAATAVLDVQVLWGDRMTENMHNLGLAIGREFFIPSISHKNIKRALFAFYRLDYDKGKGAHINLNLMQEGSLQERKFYLPILADQKDSNPQVNEVQFAKLNNSRISLMMQPAEMDVLRYMCARTQADYGSISPKIVAKLDTELGLFKEFLKSAQAGYLQDKYGKLDEKTKKTFNYFLVLKSGGVLQTLFNQPANQMKSGDEKILNKSDEIKNKFNI